mgnify:CR=1 FL=1
MGLLVGKRGKRKRDPENRCRAALLNLAGAIFKSFQSQMLDKMVKELFPTATKKYRVNADITAMEAWTSERDEPLS